jgi:hypothetical protein
MTMATKTRPTPTTRKAGFNLDPALIRRFRIAALEQDRTMTDVIEELIREWLARQDGRASRGR